MRAKKVPSEGKEGVRAKKVPREGEEGEEGFQWERRRFQVRAKKA